MPKSLSIALAGCAALGLAGAAFAAAPPRTAEVSLIDANGIGAKIGTLSFVATKQGVEIIPNLHGLPPGLHGFHVHEKPDCDAVAKDGKMMPGLAAGGHWDPGHTGKHLGPEGEGHRGDLGMLAVDSDGSATLPVLAPRLKPKDLAGHALIIHAGADNFSDTPSPLGGGGARIACAVVK